MDRFRRQRQLIRNVPNCLAVVGCGGVGSWFAIFATLIGVKRLWLFDHDVIDVSNLNRTVYKQEDIGTRKVDALRNELYRLSTIVEVITSYAKFERDCFPKKDNRPEVIVDCTDDPESQRLIDEVCSELDMKYLRLGCDAHDVTISLLPAPEWGDQNPGYGQPAWIAPPAIAAAYGIAYLVGQPVTVTHIGTLVEGQGRDCYVETKKK